MRTVAKSAIAWLAILFSVCQPFPALAGYAEEYNRQFRFDADSNSKKQRVIDFPKAASLGEIIISITPGSGRDGHCLSGAARGQVTVPAKRFVTFIPAHRFYKDPSIVKTLPSDSVDTLVLSVCSMDDSEDGMCDRALAVVGHLTSIIELCLDNSDATDSAVLHTAEFPNLQRFSAIACALDGRCLKAFAGLKKLRCMSMQGNHIADKNIQYLGNIQHLEYFDISNNQISDAGVAGLAGCSRLVRLKLSGNRDITDRSIATLSALKTLRYLQLGGTQITGKGVLRLQGLKLKQLELPDTVYPGPVLNQIRKAFPDTAITSSSSKTLMPDARTRDLYAPLH